MDVSREAVGPVVHFISGVCRALDGMTTSRRCYTSCTDFRFGSRWTSRWPLWSTNVRSCIFSLPEFCRWGQGPSTHATYCSATSRRRQVACVDGPLGCGGFREGRIGWLKHSMFLHFVFVLMHHMHMHMHMRQCPHYLSDTVQLAAAATTRPAKSKLMVTSSSFILFFW